LKILNYGETQYNTQANMSVIGCASSKTGFSKSKRKERASVPKPKETNIKNHSMNGGTFKSQVDKYYVEKYSQLLTTTTKIINKYNRNIEANNVISAAYLHIIDQEQEITHFARTFCKSLEHVIYSFTLRYINTSLMWSNSKLINETNKFITCTINIDDEDTQEIEYQKITDYQDNIYTEDFIKSFEKTLKKLDAICFKLYYYEGADNAKLLAVRFDISESSAYTIINRLKKLLKIHIAKNKIE
jgi:hypothetical protein